MTCSFIGFVRPDQWPQPKQTARPSKRTGPQIPAAVCTFNETSTNLWLLTVLSSSPRQYGTSWRNFLQTHIVSSQTSSPRGCHIFEIMQTQHSTHCSDALSRFALHSCCTIRNTNYTTTSSLLTNIWQCLVWKCYNYYSKQCCMITRRLMIFAFVFYLQKNGWIVTMHVLSTNSRNLLI